MTVERVGQLVDGLWFDGGTRGFRGRRAYSELAREVAAACEALIDSEPAAVPALVQRAVELMAKGIGYMGDRSGILSDDLRSLLAVHTRACAVARPDPKRLAEWLVRMGVDGEGASDLKLRDYAAVLGEEGRAELARLVEDRARTTDPDSFASIMIHKLREQLAEISGDVDRHVAVLAEGPTSARQYLAIVNLLRNAGRAADAEHWTRQGLDLDDEVSDRVSRARLREIYVDLLLARDATDEALAAMWRVFNQWPTHSHYCDLRGTAARTGDWPGLRDKAIKRLREVVVERPHFADDLISVLLDEGEADEAWQVAVDHADRLAGFRWHELIDLRQPAHPQDVIEPWQRLIQSVLEDKSDTDRYSNAIDMLRRLRDAYRAAGNTTGFENYVNGLRDRHKRKTTFIAKLDRADL